MAGELAAGQRVADIVRRPDPAVRGEGAGALGESARGERNVGGDADIAGGDLRGDPVIGGVGRVADRDHPDIRQAGRADRPREVGDDENGQAEPGRDAVDLLAHRAGIAIDVD